MLSLRYLIRKLQGASHLLPALRFVWKGSPRWTLAHVTLIFIQGLLPIALLYLTKLIIDTVTNSIALPDKTLLFQRLLVLLGLMGAVTVIAAILAALAELVNSAQTQQVTDYMQGIVHAKSLEIDLEYYENPDYHNSLQRAQQEAFYRPNQILEHLIQLGQTMITLVLMVGLLVALHWGIAGILFAASVPSILVRLKYASILHAWQRRRTEMQRQGEYLSWLLTGDWFAKELRLFDLGNLFSQRFQRIRKQLYQETLQIGTQRAIANVLAQSLSALLLFSAYSFVVYQAFQGQLQIGDLVLYHAALQQGQAALKGLLGSLSALYEDNLFLSNLYEFLELQPKIAAPLHPKPLPRPMRSGIVFDRVSFQYSNTPRWALKDASLTIRPGEVIALVGENGSGKTTLIKLLCRLYEPTQGKITLDGVALEQYDLVDLRRQISVVFQDYVKYYFTAWENIWFGNIELPPGAETVMQAAKQSGADAVIQTLPQGYDTMLGKLFEQGEELSIGQWQKVALARAFLRQSQLVVLDEPTSAMDPKAEYEVFQQFRQLIQNQSAILISHRLSTVKMADRIYVVDRGTIVEQGTHTELMQLNGRYAHLFETQAQNYR